jgi:hypothetical protein
LFLSCFYWIVLKTDTFAVTQLLSYILMCRPSLETAWILPCHKGALSATYSKVNVHFLLLHSAPSKITLHFSSISVININIMSLKCQKAWQFNIILYLTDQLDVLNLVPYILLCKLLTCKPVLKNCHWNWKNRLGLGDG